VDGAILEWLNGDAQGQPWRALAQFVAVGFVAVPVLVLVVLLVRGVLARSARAVSVAVLTVAGLAVAVAVNYGLAHLYFRPRPYWVDASVRALLPRDGDSSFTPWQVIVAAAASAGIAFISRTGALVSSAATVLLMVALVAVGQNNPGDTLIAALVGVAFVMLLLPLRHRFERLLDRKWKPEAAMSESELSVARRSRRSRVGHVLAIGAAVALAAIGGYALARVQTHGTATALSRANARLAATLPSDMRVYGQVSIDDLAAGKVKASHARVYGKITYIHKYEPDGDIHMEIRAPDDAFVVLEVPPEFPLQTLPSKGQMITAWGIVRKDGLHQWWELHPLVGWAPGHVNSPSSTTLQD
jgi:hypothetical protein